MMHFRTIGLIAKHDDARTGKMLGRLIALLRKRGARVVLDKSAVAYLPEIGALGAETKGRRAHAGHRA